MTDDEQLVLKNYLLRIGKFPGNCNLSKRNLQSLIELAEAKAYALGCADVRLQTRDHGGNLRFDHQDLGGNADGGTGDGDP